MLYKVAKSYDSINRLLVKFNSIFGAVALWTWHEQTTWHNENKPKNQDDKLKKEDNLKKEDKIEIKR